VAALLPRPDEFGPLGLFFYARTSCPVSTVVASQRYREANQLGGLNTLREKGSGALVGYCGLLVQTVDDLLELEIGYSLLLTHWGQGYATEAALTCKAFARTHHLAQSVISIISLTNVASQRVALNLGMHVEKVTWYAANEVNIFR
jgi:ribosomal-protein-alanine N-acetyltransferase